MPLQVVAITLAPYVVRLQVAKITLTLHVVRLQVAEITLALYVVRPPVGPVLALLAGATLSKPRSTSSSRRRADRFRAAPRA